VGQTGVSLESYYSNINSNINIDYIYIPFDQIKNKSKTLVKELEKLVSSLVGNSDLSDVSVDDIIELWNTYSSRYKLPKVILNKNS